MKSLQGSFAAGEEVECVDQNSIYYGMSGLVVRLSSAGFIIYYHVQLQGMVFSFRDFQIKRV